jgi:TRAP-type C4-dicarboxylate transport system permease small subunit
VLRIIDRIIHTVAEWFSRIGQVALFLVAILIGFNVVIRIWWKPVPGTYELVEILGATLLALGVAYCAVKRGHVSVDVVVDQFPRWAQDLTDALTHLIGAVVIFAVGREAIRQAGRMMVRGLRTAHLHFPVFPVYYLVAFGIIILGFVLIARSVGFFVSLFGGIGTRNGDT